ncbi:hypothetical protein ACWAT4_21475 [Bradyrhizobium manausense]
MTREIPANADMIEGFNDGYDLTAPEPSANRSRSYRHGFMCGRIDKGQIASPGAQRLRQMADEAMAADDTSTVWQGK